MLSLEDALEQLLAAIPPLEPENVAVGDAPGRYAAENAFAACDLPPFTNSAVDGYAIRAADLATAAPEHPVVLPQVSRTAAGEPPAPPLPPGACARVFTGAPLPAGADAVLRQEDADPDDQGQVRFRATAQPGDNLRPQGVDVRRGALLLSSGDRLSAASAALLSAAGLPGIRVGRCPRVAVLSTGDELVEPGRPLEPGQIYESNRAMLAALIRRSGGVPTVFPVVRDTLEATRAALAQAFDTASVVVTSGGVSVGESDWVRRAFQDLGGTLEFWRVAMRPGKPFVFGRWDRRYLFGLPGNPASALVTCAVLVHPALVRLQGGAELALPRQTALLDEPFRNEDDRRHFVRVRIDQDGHARSAGLQASHALSSLARCHGLLDLPAQTSWEPGRTVQVLRLD